MKPLPASSRWERLARSKERRDAYSESQFDIEFPFQVTRLMEARGLTIEDLVDKGIPREQLEGEEEYTTATLHELASVFDVGLLVTFVPFSELVRREQTIKMEQFTVPSFEQDAAPASRTSTVLFVSVPTVPAHYDFDHGIVMTQICTFGGAPAPLGAHVTARPVLPPTESIRTMLT